MFSDKAEIGRRGTSRKDWKRLFSLWFIVIDMLRLVFDWLGNAIWRAKAASNNAPVTVLIESQPQHSRERKPKLGV